MKKKSREISAFSISALDLFCSAMGVFMIICFIIMNQRERESAPIEIPPQTEVIQSLTLVLSWECACRDLSHEGQNEQSEPEWHALALGDVDMAVKYKELVFTPHQKEHNNFKALYAADAVNGGADVWTAALAPPGDYRVYYKVTRGIGNNLRVECADKRYNSHYRWHEICGFRLRLRTVSPQGTHEYVKTVDLNTFCTGNSNNETLGELIGTIHIAEDGKTDFIPAETES